MSLEEEESGRLSAVPCGPQVGVCSSEARRKRAKITRFEHLCRIRVTTNASERGFGPDVSHDLSKQRSQANPGRHQYATPAQNTLGQRKYPIGKGHVPYQGSAAILTVPGTRLHVVGRYSLSKPSAYCGLAVAARPAGTRHELLGYGKTSATHVE
jgi:hypothetical protein